MEQEEVTLQSHARLYNAGTFSEELLEKILRGVSAQTYADTVLNAAHAVGVAPTAISQTLGELTAAKLKTFQERSLKDVTLSARFLDTIHRGGEAFVVALGVDVSGRRWPSGSGKTPRRITRFARRGFGISNIAAWRSLDGFSS